MAIWNKTTQAYNVDNSVQFEAMVLASENGITVDENNPLPVTNSTIGNADAFGRSRMSEPFTLGDYKHVYGLDPNFIDYAVNGGTTTFQANKACARLATTSNSSSRIVHQTKMYHHYMPGKSQLMMSSFCFYGPTSNVVKRTGYFDDSNGIFFQQNGSGVLSMVIRSSVTGSPVENVVNQAQWDDKCDGTGPSKFNLDITKTQLFWMDFQWLGVGRVRVGFVHNGKLIICHNFYHSNNLDTVYLSNPNLPVRCEIANVGTTTGAFFDQICSTVISEGGYVESGSDVSFQNPSLRSLAAGATIPVLAIRLKNTFNTYSNRLTVRAGNVSVFSSASNVLWKLMKLSGNSALNTGAWADANTGVSAVEYNITATGTPTGEVIDGGFIGANTQNASKVAAGAMNPNTPSASKKNFIAQNYASTDSEIYVLVATNVGADTTTVGASMQWREIL